MSYVLDTVYTVAPEPAYDDPHFRQEKGYKSGAVHAAPFRRNRDFKPVPYGAFGGMPNYRHAEPFALLKNVKDFSSERHHMPTKWFKSFLFGAGTGIMFGSMWFAIAPINAYAAQKLFSSVGERAWSGRMFRLFRQIAPRHAMFGGATFASYTIITDMLRHHDHTNLRPRYMDHAFAMTVIGGAIGAICGKKLRTAVATSVFSFITLAPLLWWFSFSLRPGCGGTPARIYYEHGVTEEEKERF